jgi:hypothetical protein
MFSSIIDIITKVIAIIFIIVIAVERPADGPAKRAEAIVAIKALVAQLNIPQWAKEVFSMDVILGYLVDLAVKTLKSTGIFAPGN